MVGLLTNKRIDWLCVAVLFAFCLIGRVLTFHAVALSVDEHQFLATGTYNALAGTSEFDHPYGPVHVFGVFRLLAQWFGPYPLLASRILMSIIAFAAAFTLYLLVGRALSPAYGLFSGLIFLAINPYFSGLVSTREWLCIPFILGGICLFLKSYGSEYRWLWLACSGAAFGMTVWFKLQAFPILGTVPLILIYEACTERDVRDLGRRVAWFAAGGAVTGLLFFLPFIVHGTLDEYLAFVTHTAHHYVLEGGLPPNSAASTDSGLTVAELYRGFFLRRFSIPLLISYTVVACWLALSIFRREWAVASGLNNRTLVAFVSYLITAMVAVSLGRRYFSQYFLFMIPAVAALTAFAVHAVIHLPKTRWAATGVVVASFLVVLSGMGDLEELTPDVQLILLITGPLVLVLCFSILKIESAHLFAKLIFLVIVGLQSAVLLATPAFFWSLEKAPAKDLQVAEFLKSSTDPDDRLFVWGWRPVLYTLSDLKPASSYTITSYVISDDQALRAGRANVNNYHSDQLMKELAQSKPSVIVDAGAEGYTLSVPETYDLKNYPPLAELLEREYRLAARVEGYVIYIRED